MAKHLIEVEGLIGFKKKQYVRYASSFRGNSSKELRCMLNGGYEVWSNKEKVLETKKESVAIDKYNMLP